MANQVPDQVLAWLYSVLREYHDPQRTYSDAARSLATYPSLTPRTQVHTNDHGREALLLTLTGTIPVTFRGAQYRFPLQIWIPHAYPRESPMVYVIPGKEMVVRPGQHVGVEGRVYHPYLRDWARGWDRSNVVEFLDILQKVFAKEPPVVGKQQTSQHQQSHPSTMGQLPPQLPPKQSSNSGPVMHDTRLGTPNPPPRPPKPGDETPRQSTPSRNWGSNGPPLPPLPGERQQPQPQQQQFARPPESYSIPLSTPPFQQMPPIMPNGRPPSSQHPLSRINHDRNSPVSPITPVAGYSELPERTSYPQQPPPQPNYQQPGPSYSQGGSYPPNPRNTLQQPQHPPANEYRQQGPPNNYQRAPPPSQPAPDLLTDPFEIAMPAQPAHDQPAPPIPPNPEKEHLLQAISASLTQQAQQSINQNLSARSALVAQQAALQSAHARLQGELHQLDQLGQTLNSNERILHKAIADCDATIASTKNKPPPPIDDVLVAPSLVAQQLWTLCAEDAAGKEAMYVLQQAVDRGRIGADVFVRTMRGLAREAFLRKVIMRKCATGMGLEVGGMAKT